jgi:cell division protein FtsZ
MFAILKKWFSCWRTKKAAPKQPCIKIIGVGGGGGNIVASLYRQGICNAQFIVCTTDMQALSVNPVPHKLRLGTIPLGLGAGGCIDTGRKAAEESSGEIRKLLANTVVVFIVATMGRGTGTGASPVIARIAKEMGIKTIAMVTAPFQFEGTPSHTRAQSGIAALKAIVDSITVFDNERMLKDCGDLTMNDSFSMLDKQVADEINAMIENQQ